MFVSVYRFFLSNFLFAFSKFHSHCAQRWKRRRKMRIRDRDDFAFMNRTDSESVYNWIHFTTADGIIARRTPAAALSTDSSVSWACAVLAAVDGVKCAHRGRKTMALGQANSGGTQQPMSKQNARDTRKPLRIWVEWKLWPAAPHVLELECECIAGESRQFELKAFAVTNERSESSRIVVTFCLQNFLSFSVGFSISSFPTFAFSLILF